MEKKQILSLTLGLIIGLAIFATYNFILPLAKKQSVAEDVRKLYEIANPGSSAEISSIQDEGNLYKVLLKLTSSQGTNYVETYVTKDGRFLTENVIFVKESIQQIEKMKNFVDCLFNKGVRIYGATAINNTQIATATMLQLNILGRYSGKLYVSCDGNNLQNCINMGLQALPALVYNNTAYYGVFNVDYIANLTNCKV